MKKLRTLFYRVFKCYRRLEVGCFTYTEADRMIRESEGKPESEQWVIAREEDTNTVIGVVFLERRERIL